MRFIKSIVIYIMISFLLVGCKPFKNAEKLSETFNKVIEEKEQELTKSLEVIKELEAKIEKLEAEKADYDNAEETILDLAHNVKYHENQIEELLGSVEAHKKASDDLRVKLGEMEWEIANYSAINEDYRRYIDVNIDEVILDDRCVKVNGIGIGSSYMDVKKAFGTPLIEETMVSESGVGGTNSIMFWKYEGIEIYFDPLYVYSIRLASIDYGISDIKIGDNAVKALDIMDNKYEQTISTHNGEVLKGWYTTLSDNLIMVVYDKESHISSQGVVNKDMKVEEIEIFNGVFP